MPWDRAPQDRATAQILIVFGAMISGVGIVVLWVAIATGALNDVSGRGIPTWLLAPLAIAAGAYLILLGVKMYRADKSPRR